MRGRGRPTPHNSHRQPAQHVSTKTWTTTTATNPDAPPEWLRRTYTRTIPKDLRTIEQLRFSFEDARQQWRSVCCKYESHASTSASKLNPRSAKNLPPGIRSAVEQVVSQVKAVKQELLAQLAHKLEDLKVSMGDSATPMAAAASQTESSWVQDLVRSRRSSSSAMLAVAHPPTPQRTAYLEALWLSRRVWVWSICLACATMDLELLSGSVSVASELFFGCLFASLSFQQSHCSGLSTNSQDCVWHSSYDLNSAVTDVEVRAANASATLIAQATEACELRAFLGAAHSDATRAVVEGVVTDTFWVHTSALCYSAVACDDASAARLLAFFDQAATLVAREKSQDNSETDVSGEGAVRGEEDLKDPDESQQLQQLITFVRQVARLLLDEDYCALQSLLRSEGYQLTGTAGSAWSETVHADPDEEHSATSLATACPEGFLVVLLVRLLGEHVVRRRWTAQNLGQAFRPIEPVQHSDGSAAHPNRLVNTLGGPPCRAAAVATTAAAMDDSTPVLECSSDAGRGSCALRLCQALQATALRDMGGDWPLPPPLLRATFGAL